MSFSSGSAKWNLGMLTDDEYTAVYIALAHYVDDVDDEYLGPPEPGEIMDVARQLLERLKTPDEAPS
jgi:hypothetical protein